MSIVCPVKSHPDWKSLVNKVGEDEAYFLWNNYNGKVPLEVANNRRKSITELRKEIGISYQINESNRPNILKKISNYNTKNQTSHSVNFDRIGQSQRLKVNLIVDFTPYSQQAREERAEMRSEEGKVFTESVQSIKEPVKEGVDSIFEQNPELANEVYEALGYETSITQDNKSYYRGQIEKPIIDKNGNLVLHAKEDELYKKAGLKSKGVSMTDDLQSAIEYGNGQLDVSKNLASEENVGIDLERELYRLDENGYYLIQIPKNISNEIVKEAGEVKVIGDKIVIPKGQYKIEQVIDGVDTQITPEQKQQAQQLYSQYLDSLNKPNTNPVLQNNQQEQVKKFTELQERLNNKEFLEGAKNAYESTPDLQQFGTQEEYNDYIARVSLGIIRNPSSGEYNYESQVKDIVYHGTDNKFEKYLKEKIGSKESGNFSYGFNFIGTKHHAKQYSQYSNSDIVLEQIINVKNPFIITPNKASSYIDVESLNLKDKQLLISIGLNLDKFETVYDAIKDFGVIKFTKELKELGYDGFIRINNYSSPANAHEYVVFEPEQIHILGSKQDIEGFKEFVRKSLPLEQQEQLKQKESNLQEYNKVKKAETMEEVKAQMLKDFDSYYPQFKDLLSWEKEMFIDMMSEGEINTYC